MVQYTLPLEWIATSVHYKQAQRSHLQQTQLHLDAHSKEYYYDQVSSLYTALDTCVYAVYNIRTVYVARM